MSGDVAEYCEGKTSCKFAIKNESFALHPPLGPSARNPTGAIATWFQRSSGLFRGAVRPAAFAGRY
jgi:hypothetical protein